MSKAKFDAAKELIKEKQYDEARAILKTIDHPTAREWEARIDALSPGSSGSKSAAGKPKAQYGTARTFRWIWGILTLLSCGWIGYGIIASSAAVGNVVLQATPTIAVINNALGTPIATSDPKIVQGAQALGAAVGGGIGITVFICTGLPFLLLFGFLYWRNGVAIRNAKQHAETIDALKTRA